MNITWLMRMKRWVQNPPSAGRVKFVFAVVLAGALIFAAEYFGYWPEWATTQRIKNPF